MNQNEEEEKDIPLQAPKYEAAPEDEEEYDIEEKKEEEEYNLENQSLDEFMTSIRLSAAAKAADPKYGQYNTMTAPASTSVQTPIVQTKKTTEDDEIFGFAQGAKDGLDDFDQLFNENPDSTKPLRIHTLAPQDPKAQVPGYEQSSNQGYTGNVHRQTSHYGQGANPFDALESKYTGIQYSKTSGNGNGLW